MFTLSCQPRGRMNPIFSDGARSSLAFEDTGCCSEVLPIVVQMFIVNIINQHLDLSPSARSWCETTHVTCSRSCCETIHVTCSWQEGTWHKRRRFRFRLKTLHSHSIHPPSTWPNKEAALLTYINYKWKRCHTLQLWGWLCNYCMTSLMIIILFSILQAAKSVGTWSLCGCIGGKLRDGHLSISSNCSKFMWYTCDCTISTHDLAQKCAARNHVDYI